MRVYGDTTVHRLTSDRTHDFGRDPGHVDVDGEVVGVYGDPPCRRLLLGPQVRALAGIRRRAFLVP